MVQFRIPAKQPEQTEPFFGRPEGTTEEGDKETQRHLFSSPILSSRCGLPQSYWPRMIKANSQLSARINASGFFVFFLSVCVREEMAHLADPDLAPGSVCHSADINRHMQPQSHMERWHTLKVTTSAYSKIEHFCSLLCISALSYSSALTCQRQSSLQFFPGFLLPGMQWKVQECCHYLAFTPLLLPLEIHNPLCFSFYQAILKQLNITRKRMADGVPEECSIIV